MWAGVITTNCLKIVKSSLVLEPVTAHVLLHRLVGELLGQTAQA